MRRVRDVKTQQRVQGFLEGVQYSIDFISAILLLTGQVTTTGIFVVPDGFFLSFTGPVFGGVIAQGRNPRYTVALRAIDITVAILLVLNVIRVTGPYITGGRFFLVASGEIFGVKEVVGVAPLSSMNASEAEGVASYVEDTILRYTGRNHRRGGRP